MTVIRSKGVIVALVALLAMLCIVSGYRGLTPEAAEADQQGHARVTHSAVPEHAFDVTDERKLVGFAENVFVGRVVKQIGTVGSVKSADMSLPRTQFSVEVLENVKGNLDGVVTVSQLGGEDPNLNAVVLLDNDPLLEPKQEVLFTTRFDETNNHHVITTAGYGDRRIKDDAGRKKILGEFKKAKDEQIDPAARKVPDEKLKEQKDALKDAPVKGSAVPAPAE